MELISKVDGKKTRPEKPGQKSICINLFAELWFRSIFKLCGDEQSLGKEVPLLIVMSNDSNNVFYI